MNAPRPCPALFIAAPASGQGKTTFTAALARMYRNRGLEVRVFKTGPDFIDPMILQRASGNPVYQLDVWMGGEAHCQGLLYEAAKTADVILVEGVMGLFDGDPSGADLAARFGLPVLAVINGAAMAQTFGAIALGLASYRSDLAFAGIVANRIAGARHFSLIADSLPAGMRAFGWLRRDADMTLPERHLGLLQANEINDIDARIERAADGLSLVDDALPQPVSFYPVAATPLPKVLTGLRIAVAYDAAFSFVYRANLDVLRELGAKLCFFSPIVDSVLPEADALYFPGGYPELHLAKLAANRAIKDAIRQHYVRGKSIVAECGGMLYLLEWLTSSDGERGEMVGLLPGHAVMHDRLEALALQQVVLPEGELRGHTFHYSRLECAAKSVAKALCANNGSTTEVVYREGSLTASYIHFYFPSNPEAAAGLFLR